MRVVVHNIRNSRRILFCDGKYKVHSILYTKTETCNRKILRETDRNKYANRGREGKELHLYMCFYLHEHIFTTCMCVQVSVCWNVFAFMYLYECISRSVNAWMDVFLKCLSVRMYFL